MSSPTRQSAEPAASSGKGHAARGRLVVVSNRVADLSSGFQSGGLAVAVGEALSDSGGVWFGWSGERSDDARRREPEVTRYGDVRTATVALTHDEHEKYYLGFANRTLWPLLHYRLDLAEMSSQLEACYFAVNKRFAMQLRPLLRDDDLLWVHDYHLIPFAAYLRQKQVNNPIGFFLHIPFPPAEIVSALPHHTQFMRTLFAYDLVGFQTVRDRENFARYAEEHLGCRRLDDGRLKAFGRVLSIEAFPIGIDAVQFRADAEKNARLPDLRPIARSVESRHLIIGVDRLDYSKGLPERVYGIEALLESYPQYSGKIQFVQIAPPTREGVEAYDAIREELERATGQVNGRFGDFAWSPVRYINRPVPRPVLAGLFRRSRVGLVTPLRDGMNLVAKEYVAAQDPENPGVLVLSQFAGAAEQLEEALIVNPHDAQDVANAIRRALEMPLGERRARHAALWDNVTTQNIAWWRNRFLEALRASRRGHAQPVSISGELVPRPKPPTRTETIRYEDKPDAATI
ncbi:alpha,alpha-trehalose-phosphate synthase (UDP-forming) [Propylenella binzhouense]|uniref:Trehalose-6-phosphate synthase n=1 Tax=Propylenella binzhouense TaxID=2555902 RepID=A0A964T5S0_9HYPH|nr:trehalose-6-phosphate synthase [Propylenella binzhouense]MYZ47952.1 trehalose-6-phosphate synthase [Propylenella binzhouense]